MNKVKFLFGIFILGLTILMVSRILPGYVTMFLWAILLIIGSITFATLNFKDKKRSPPFLHGLSLLSLIYGSMLLMGAASGNENLTNPLKSNEHIRLARNTVPVHSLFLSVRNSNELQRKLNSAKAHYRPVLIEFYASWCHFCQELDKNVFSDEEIQRYLRSFEVLRVDLTKKNSALEKIAREYRIPGTPTLIFYDKNGTRFKTNSLNGGITKESLGKILKRLK